MEEKRLKSKNNEKVQKKESSNKRKSFRKNP